MKLKPDFKSLKFRLWGYFFLFAAVLMLLLWGLQVLFLNNYYQVMKIRETNAVAMSIQTLARSGDRTEIRSKINDLYHRNDMFIQIETESGLPIAIPIIDIPDSDNGGGDVAGSGSAIGAGDGSGVSTMPGIDMDAETDTNTPTLHIPTSVFQSEIGNLKRELYMSGERSLSKQVSDPKTGQITLEYASYLTTDTAESNLMLFIFSPLYPMASTVDILSSQLIYITIIAMVLAFILSLYLSVRISKPIVGITESAAELGEGNYGVVFDGAHFSEIIKLADTLTYTSLELAKADNMQKDLIANVSHDLRTPLTMITSYAEMIRDLSGENPEKRNAHLQVIMDEADRLNKLVGDLLEISGMASGVKSLNLEEFSLKEMIESLLQSYTGFVEQEGYKLIFISQGEGIITADQDRLKQVIANLVSNAFKYCGADKTIEVKMWDMEHHVRCEVSDHGVGIPKKDLKHIWERYYKVSSNFKRTDSTGLGLSIVKQILLLHGAEFGVQSALKKGSTFWFEIKKTPAQIIDFEGMPHEPVLTLSTEINKDMVQANG